MNDYLTTLDIEFKQNANIHTAAGQKTYMRNQFEFLGIKAPVRQKLQQPFLVKTYLPPKKDLEILVKILWNKPEREYQYFAQELVFKYSKHFDKQDILLLEFMITHKSWWDTVDFIAAKLVGNYMKKFPENRSQYVDQWLASGNLWLQRTAILFQLHYKNETDTEMLSYVINSLLGSNEFFINKAIGWILRQYGKTNPRWVIDFSKKTPLDNLSRREGLRIING